MGKKITGIDKGAIQMLHGYDFPGNIRELKNIIERAVIMSDGDMLLTEHIIFSGESYAFTEESGGGAPVPTVSMDNLDLEHHEKELIKTALERAGNNKSKAAGFLNVTWQALDRRMKKYGLE